MYGCQGDGGGRGWVGSLGLADVNYYIYMDTLQGPTI